MLAIPASKMGFTIISIIYQFIQFFLLQGRGVSIFAAAAFAFRSQNELFLYYMVAYQLIVNRYHKG